MADAAPDRDRITGTLARISEALRDFVDRGEPRGLLNGSCGAALFYAYYFQWTQDDEHLACLHRVIVSSVDALAVEPLAHSHCSGLAGIAWCLQHLINQGFIERDGADVLAPVDAILAASMDAALAEGRHDFLHEGLGMMLYFLERLPDPTAQAQLERALTHLEASALGDRGGLRWRDRFTQRGREEPGPCFNLGLAHGIPAIVSILAALHERGIATARVESLLRGAAQWLLSIQGPADGVSLYPIMVDADDRAIGPTPSRLGWCYGDLAVAIALLNAGTRLGDLTCAREASAILAHALTHRTADNGAIEDGSLCHGSMGVSHIYRRAYLATEDERFRRGADHWLAHTLALGDAPGSAAGFQCRMRDAHVDCFDLLQGITGIGLGLIAALDRDAAPAWDRCLVLS